MTTGSSAPEVDPATPTRRAALTVLNEVGRGRRLDVALSHALADLPPDQGPWLHELVYGAVRLRGRLDHCLDHCLHQGIDSLSPTVLDLLRLGAYQLLEMDGVPAYAAVSQSVEQARALGGKGLAGLVNAVLRKITLAGEDSCAFPDPETEPVAWLSTWGSHPRWMVERWMNSMNARSVEALVEWDNRIPFIYLRPLGLGIEGAVGRLAAAGIRAWEVGRGTGCVRLEAGVHPARALEVVPGVIQDPGAALVTRFAAVPPGATVADLCAAPGGKCLALAGEGAYVLAVDRSGPRLRLLRENAERLGSVGVGVVRALAEAPPVRSARVVLLDVPCTGTGTLRRHPDARWRLTPGQVGKMAEVQRRILEGAAPSVAPGGLLIYSTCTLEPEENEEQVRSFLSRHPEFQADPSEGVEPGFVDSRGFLRVTPWEHGFDGAFAARLRRIG